MFIYLYKIKFGKLKWFKFPLLFTFFDYSNFNYLHSFTLLQLFRFIKYLSIVKNLENLQVKMEEVHISNEILMQEK